MTYGGAGAALPILILLVLNIAVFLAWFFKGAGDWKAKVLVTSIAVVMFCTLVVLSAVVAKPPLLRDAIQLGTLVFPVASLLIPAVANRVLSSENT